MKRTVPWFIPCLLFVLALAGCASDDNDEPAAFPAATVQQLDAAIDAEMAAQNLPGAVVAAWIPGQGSYVVARGSADLSTGRPRAVDDPFRIASISKTFIGTAVLQLADRKRLATTDLLARWYPDFPNAELITVDHLLRMRSGIPDSADSAFLAYYYADPLSGLKAEDMIARAAARRGEFVAPGTVTHYANINFILLERIVEKASGTDIRSFLADNVFRPLGMSGTSYPTGPAFSGPLRGYSLDAASGRLVDRTVLDPTPAGGAGALISTVADLRSYARALCLGGLLDPETQRRRLLATPFENGPPSSAAYGAAVARLGPFCGHNGTIFGFSSEMWYVPAKDAVVIVSVNRLDLDDESRSAAIFGRVARILFADLLGG